MITAKRSAGKISSVPGGIAIAGCVSLITTLSGSALIAHLLDRETITWDQAGFWIMGMLFASSLLGGKCAYATIKRQRIIVSIMSGVLYWGQLLCITALFFGGNYSAVWETAGIICAGSGAAALITVPSKRKKVGKVTRGYC